MVGHERPDIDAILPIIVPVVYQIVVEDGVVAAVVHFPRVRHQEEVVADVVERGAIVRVEPLA